MSDFLNDLISTSSRQYSARFGGRPEWIVAAPGRVNLIGEHIDYNDGFVLPMAIDRYCVIAASQTASDTARIYSLSADDEIEISLSSPRRHSTPGHWSNYVAGVVSGCCEAPAMRPDGFTAVVASEVPLGGGLSSSASLEVAMATLVEAMTGATLDPKDKALLCQRAEHEYAGVPCGIMDQFASVMCRVDHLMLLDCSSQRIEHIPFVDPDVTVLIINSNVKHELVGSEYGERRQQCDRAARALGVASLRGATLDHLESNREQLSNIEYRRARHAISEIRRTFDAANAAKDCDWPCVGELMLASHRSLRDDYEVSCLELDLLVDLAQEIGIDGGVYGSRMTGGGFGGCTVSLVQATKVQQVAEYISEKYRNVTDIAPKVLTSRPSRGAHVVKSEPNGLFRRRHLRSDAATVVRP
jgi:galactokinase